jgi:hypothetical protein
MSIISGNTKQSVSGGTTPAVDLTDGLVAHYLLNNNADDVAGSYDGTVYGATALGDSIRFDGTNNYIDIGITNTANPITYSIWISIDSLTNTSTPIGSKVDSGYVENCELRVRTDGKIEFLNEYSQNNFHNTVSTTIINTNQWYHIVVTITSTETKLYIDGTLEATTYGNNLQGAFLNSPIAIGCSFYNQTYAMWTYGKLSNFRYYNSAKDSDFVTLLNNEGYHPRSLTPPPTDGLVAHYPLTGTAEDKTYNHTSTLNASKLVPLSYQNGTVAWSSVASAESPIDGDYVNWYARTNTYGDSANVGRGIGFTFAEPTAVKTLLIYGYIVGFSGIVEYYNGSSWVSIKTFLFNENTQSVNGFNCTYLEFNEDGAIEALQWRWYITSTNGNTSINYYLREVEMFDVIDSEYNIVSYNGTEYGVTYVDDAEKGSVASFDGVDDYITTPITGSFECISFWFNDGITYAGDDTTKVIAEVDNATYGGAFQLGGAAGGLSGETFTYYGQKGYTYITDTIYSGWNHIVVQFETDRYVIYLNGQSVTTGYYNYTYNATRATLDLTLGYRAYFSQYYSGKLSNIRVYNRALTPQEITDIYNYEKSYRPIPVSDGLVAYYPLETNSQDNYFNQYNLVDGTGIAYDGTSAEYPAQNSYTYSSTAPVKLLDGLSTYTINCWVHMVDTGYGGILTNNDSGWNQYGMQFCMGASTIIFTHTRSDAVSSNNAVSTPQIQGEWHMYTAHRVGTAIKLYEDGVLVDSNTLIHNTTANYINSEIGRYYNGSPNTPQARVRLSGLRCYNRAISEDEISLIYNTEKSKFGL